MDTETQRAVGSMVNPRGGLGQMLAQHGASDELVETAAEIEQIPGGMELLYTYAAEQMMREQGVPEKDVRKVRLYSKGGGVGYQEGGSTTMRAAQITKQAGRGDDSMMLHVTPEEFETITAMWGPPDINPDTGIAEYGWLGDVFKKVKKAVKKVFSSKAFRVIAPIALSVFAPGLGTAIGSALAPAAGAATQGILGNALVQGGLGAVSGGKEGFLRGAALGAVSGGLGKIAGAQVKSLAPGLSQRTADIVGSSLAAGAGTKLAGGDFGRGAVLGGLGEFARPAISTGVGKARAALGLRATPGKVFAGRIEEGFVPPEGAAPGTTFSLTEEPLGTGAMSPLDPGLQKPTLSEMVGAAPITPPTYSPVAGAAAPPVVTPTEAPETQSALSRYALPAAAGAAALYALSGDEEPYSEDAPEIPESFGQSLPVYSLERRFEGMPEESYYTYGQVGAPQSGQHLFIQPTEPFPGETGPLAPPGALEEATGTGLQPIPVPTPKRTGRFSRENPELDRLLAEGWTRRGDMLYPPTETMTGKTRLSSAQGRYVRGGGTGRSDDIPARLSDGEYVIDAESVALLGDGSGDAGARRLDEMRRNLRKHKAKNLGRGEFSHKAKAPHKYMSGRS